MSAAEAARSPLSPLRSRGLAALELAAEIARLAREHEARGERFVLGLASGSSPLELYAELARSARRGDLPRAPLELVALDEYLGLAAGDPRSFAAYYREHVLEPFGLDARRLWIPRCDAAEHELAAHLAELRERLAELGPPALQLVGLGRNGHVAFDEPGSSADCRLRKVALAPETRADACRAFGTLEAVPREALTLGLAEIRSARRVRGLAFGAHKREAARRALLEPPSARCPASFLRDHPDLVWYVDEEAAAGWA